MFAAFNSQLNFFLSESIITAPSKREKRESTKYLLLGMNWFFDSCWFVCVTDSEDSQCLESPNASEGIMLLYHPFALHWAFCTTFYCALLSSVSSTWNVEYFWCLVLLCSHSAMSVSDTHSRYHYCLDEAKICSDILIPGISKIVLSLFNISLIALRLSPIFFSFPFF